MIIGKKELYKQNKAIQRLGKGVEAAVIKDFESDVVHNIVNNYGSYWPDGIFIKAVLAPIKFRNKEYDNVNPFFPNHYLNIRAGGIPLEINGIKFKAAPTLRTKCSKRCMTGREYEFVDK
jgi:hypothetical protein